MTGCGGEGGNCNVDQGEGARKEGEPKPKGLYQRPYTPQWPLSFCKYPEHYTLTPSLLWASLEYFHNLPSLVKRRCPSAYLWCALYSNTIYAR